MGHLFVVHGDLHRLDCDGWLLPTDADADHRAVGRGGRARPAARSRRAGTTRIAHAGGRAVRRPAGVAHRRRRRPPHADALVPRRRPRVRRRGAAAVRHRPPSPYGPAGREPRPRAAAARPAAGGDGARGHARRARRRPARAAAGADGAGGRLGGRPGAGHAQPAALRRRPGGAAPPGRHGRAVRPLAVRVGPRGRRPARPAACPSSSGCSSVRASRWGRGCRGGATCWCRWPSGSTTRGSATSWPRCWPNAASTRSTWPRCWPRGWWGGAPTGTGPCARPWPRSPAAVPRHALAHGLLASLGVGRAVTTNYDALYEQARAGARASGGGAALRPPRPRRPVAAQAPRRRRPPRRHRPDPPGLPALRGRPQRADRRRPRAAAHPAPAVRGVLAERPELPPHRRRGPSGPGPGRGRAEHALRHRAGGRDPLTRRARPVGSRPRGGGARRRPGRRRGRGLPPSRPVAGRAGDERVRPRRPPARAPVRPPARRRPARGRRRPRPGGRAALDAGRLHGTAAAGCGGCWPTSGTAPGRGQARDSRKAPSDSSTWSGAVFQPARARRRAPAGR